jgi:tctex1 domain-containing protein 2
MAQASGLRSPPASVSPAPSPRLKFDGDLLKAYIKKLLSTTLQNSPWPDAKDRDRVKAWIREIGERVKERMLEIQPQGL